MAELIKSNSTHIYSMFRVEVNNRLTNRKNSKLNKNLKKLLRSQRMPRREHSLEPFNPENDDQNEDFMKIDQTMDKNHCGSDYKTFIFWFHIFISKSFKETENQKKN